LQYAFLPIFLFAACAIVLAVGLLLLAGLFNPGRSGRVTRMPYESGMDPIHDTRRRFDVRFHLLAIAFLVFDVELLFLFPWAVAEKGIRDWGLGMEERMAEGGRRKEEVEKAESGKPRAESRRQTSSPAQGPWPLAPSPSSLAPRPSPSRHLVFGGAMTFLALLILGFVYDWRKGVFEWR
jgi:NADH-quinone oxidoreductase subunit A